MNAIVGIDAGSAYKPAIQLLARFQFENPRTTLAHFVDAVPPFLPFDATQSALIRSDFLNASENVGLTALDHAKDEACLRDVHPKCQLRRGKPADGLIRLAEESKADLGAVRSEQGALWATSFLGSVSRALAIGCRSSLLVAKAPIDERIPLKVVLATDHSPAADRWLDRFIAWHPRGIAEVHVVTAYELGREEGLLLKSHLPALNRSVESWIEGHLAEQNAKVVAKLQAAGLKADARVAVGRANDVIRQTMQDTQSDVLVLGAQGHGFIDRLLIGSCAMHQVLAEPYPVLVVRG